MDTYTPYLKRVFKENRHFIRIFSAVLLLNAIYTTIIRFVYIGFFSVYFSVVTFALVMPITLAAVVMGDIEVYKGPLYIFKQCILAANSVLFAFVLQLRSILCTFAIEAQCSAGQRPLSEGLYAYVLAGPVLTLFIYTNSVLYQGAFMLAFFIFLAVTDIWVNTDTSHILTLVLIAGFYLLTLYMSSRYRKADQVQALLDRQKELEESSHAFVSYMLHELRNPMNNATLILSADHSTAEDRAASIQELEGAKVIMDDALAYSTLSSGLTASGEYENGLLTVWRQVHAMFEKSTTAKGIILTCEYGEDVRKVVLPAAGQFKQILMILLRYSISRSREGDTVAISFEFDEALKVHLVDQGRREWALVGQSNLSIQYHTSDSNRGQELSLNLALKLLETLGCDVVISNTVTSGFDITFTCTAREDVDMVEQSMPFIQEEIPFVATPASPAAFQPLHILITDDNAITCKFLKILLTKMRHTSDIAVDGVDCLKKLESHHYDLILLDSMMPRLDGPGVLLYLRKNALTVPVISVTANTEATDVAELLKLGARLVLPKPVSIKALEEAITTVFDIC